MFSVKKKNWKIRTLGIYIIKQPPEKITLIWNPVDLIPKSHDILPLPLAKELTLKCKRHGKGWVPSEHDCDLANTLYSRGINTLLRNSGPGSLSSLGSEGRMKRK